mmetsp:Transcript_16422/g.37862  ORF Transcript_16422/g.37862 Transcript_16422/m.37862 type:complete len:419 (+) Transcript_16422:52-1308(+)
MGTSESTLPPQAGKGSASPGVSTSDLATAPPSEVEVMPAFEWEEALDSGDEDEEERILQAHATSRFELREKRLTVVAAKLETAISIGDVDVEVQQQQKEWEGDSDLDATTDDSSPPSFQQHAADSFHTREKRLSVAIEVQQQDKIYGDMEVHVTTAHSEWAGDDSDSEEEVGAQEVAQSLAGEMFTKRERRLTAGAEAINRGLCIGDAEVQVTPQDTEWSAALSEDEAEQHETQVFAKRERRLSQRTELLEMQALMGDAEVQVVSQESEWSADPETAEHSRAEEHHAEQFQLRERRLTVAADRLASELVLGDVKVQVHTQDSEWDPATDSEDEDPKEQLQRRASECFEQRERRLSAASEVLQANPSIGDAKVEVVAVEKEWESSADEQAEKLDEHEKELFARREKRLSLAAESLAASA